MRWNYYYLEKILDYKELDENIEPSPIETQAN